MDFANMKSVDKNVVSAFDAKTHLSRLLHEVEQGQSITITRHGKPVARLVPIADRRAVNSDALLAKAKALRDSVKGKVDVVALIKEGRRY